MLCPFKRVTTRLPSGQTNGQAFGLCSAENCMAYQAAVFGNWQPSRLPAHRASVCRTDSVLLHVRLGRRRDKPGGAG